MKQKNILFLIDDQHRGDALSYIGHPIVKTPNLDKLAKMGVTYSNCYTPSALCQPARTSIVTGEYPTQHQILQNRMFGLQNLSKSKDTFLKHLSDAGYYNTLAGKWHVGRDGSEKYLGIHDVIIALYDNRPPVKDGHGWMWYSREYLYADTDNDYLGEPSHSERDFIFGYYKLDKLLKTNKPWFLQLSLLGPHDPYYVSNEMLDLYPIDSIKLPENWEVDLTKRHAHLPISRIQNNMFKLTEQEVKEYIRHYYAYISTIDKYFGEVIEKVKDSGKMKDTVIIFTSDHGDHAGEFQLMGKERNFYEGITKVPFIIYDNDKFNSGEINQDFISLMDLPHTFCDIANAKPINNNLDLFHKN